MQVRLEIVTMFKRYSFQPRSLNLECNIDIALLLMAPPVHSAQNKQANFKTISDQEVLMLDITSRDLLS